MMELSIDTKQVPFRLLNDSHLVVIGRKVKRVVSINPQRRTVTVSLGQGCTDVFPADWFHEGALWTVVDA